MAPTEAVSLGTLEHKIYYAETQQNNHVKLQNMSVPAACAHSHMQLKEWSDSCIPCQDMAAYSMAHAFEIPASPSCLQQSPQNEMDL